MEFIGIDVAKAQLDFAGLPSGATGTVPNEDGGIRELVARCQTLTPTLIVLEATGGYEAARVAALATAGFPLVVVNPRQVRDFAKATGQLAKTDTIDAQVLALFAERVRPAPRALPDDAAQALEALLTRRRQLVEMLTAERNRLLVARAPVRRDLQQQIRFLERRLREADDDLHTPVKASPLWRVKDDLLQSVPGVGAWSPLPCSPSSPSWAGSPTRRLPPWWEWLPSRGTAGRSVGSVWSTAAARQCGPRCTWRRSWPADAIRSFEPSTTGAAPRASRRSSRSPPACGSCSSSSTRSRGAGHRGSRHAGS
jgi:hypothetical protein